MKEITTNNQTILLVEVPEDAREFKIENGLLLFKADFIPFGIVILPSGQYQILGKSTELSEEQMKEICASIFGKYYFDYMNKDSGGYAPGFTLYTVQESYLSLLEANGIVDRCDIEEPEIYHDDGIREPCKYDYPHGFDLEQYHKDLKQWQEAQSKVKHYLILKRI